MKKFTKIMLSVAAVTAVSSAMAISAMAAEVSVSGDFTGKYDADGETEPALLVSVSGDFTGKYDTESGVITLDSAVKSTENSTTLLVVDTDGTVEEANIFQIDQDDKSNGFKEIKLDKSKIEEGTTYYVRVGGDGTVKTASFTIGGEPVGKETVTIKIGDINFDGNIRMNDASAVASKSVGTSNAQNANVSTERTVVSSEIESLTEGKVIKIGDINFDGNIRMNDASAIASKSVGTSNTQNANVGKTADVEVVE